MNRRFSFLPFLLLGGCSVQQPQGECGESFCLPVDAKLVEVLAPVEDFKFYRIEWRGQPMEIYEGNQPKKRPEASSVALLNLPLDNKAALRFIDHGGSILVRMGDDWPMYLEVTGSCSSTEQCSVASFAKELERR